VADLLSMVCMKNAQYIGIYCSRLLQSVNFKIMDSYLDLQRAAAVMVWGVCSIGSLDL